MLSAASRPLERIGVAGCALIGAALGGGVLAALELPKDLAIFSILVLFLFAATLSLPDPKRGYLVLMILSFCIWRSFYLGEVDEAHRGGSQAIGEFFLSDVWLFLLLAAWGTGKGTREGTVPVSRLDLAVCALLFWCLVSVVASGMQTLGWADLLRVVKVTLMYFYVSRNITSEGELKTVCWTLFFTLAAQSLCSVYLFCGGAMPFGLFQNAELEEADLFAMTRVGGTLGITGTAVFFELMIPLAVAMAFFSPRCALSRVAWPLFALGMTAVAFTFSRTSIVALSLSVLILWPWAFVTQREARARLLLFLLLFGVLLVFFTWMALPRLEQGYVSHTAEIRGDYATIAREMIESRPLFGVGLNSFYEHAPGYSAFRGALLELFGVHNVYLSFAAETGLPSLLILGWIFVESIVLAWAVQRKGSPLVRALALGIAASLCGSFLVSSNLGMGFKYLYPIWSYLWLFLGLLTAMHRMEGGVGATEGKLIGAPRSTAQEVAFPLCGSSSRNSGEPTSVPTKCDKRHNVPPLRRGVRGDLPRDVQPAEIAGMCRQKKIPLSPFAKGGRNGLAQSFEGT